MLWYNVFLICLNALNETLFNGSDTLCFYIINNNLKTYVIVWAMITILYAINNLLLFSFWCDFFVSKMLLLLMIILKTTK
jgi:hypothetical protein